MLTCPSYLIPDPVVEVCHPRSLFVGFFFPASPHTWQYIDEHHLFQGSNPGESNKDKEKDKAAADDVPGSPNGKPVKS